MIENKEKNNYTLINNFYEHICKNNEDLIINDLICIEEELDRYEKLAKDLDYVYSLEHINEIRNCLKEIENFIHLSKINSIKYFMPFIYNSLEDLSLSLIVEKRNKK